MRAASAVTADPAESLLREFQDTLSARQDTLLTWRAADGSTHLAVLHDCGLALTKVSLGYKLTAIFMGGAPPGPAPESGQPSLIERGRRVLKHGSLIDLQELAVRLLRQGVRGGPSYDDGPLQWAIVRTDGSLRMTVPGGELRVCPIAQKASSVLDSPEAPCTLTFESSKGIYAIARDAGARLQAEALEIWQQQKVRHALQIRLHGKCVNLRSASMPGVLGYHAVAERTFIVLVWVEDELGLYYLDGRQSVRLARLTLRDVRNGEPPNVDALLLACAREAANAGPSQLVEPPANGPHDDVADDVADPAASASAWADTHPSAEDSLGSRSGLPVHSGRAPGPGYAPMAQWQLELCQRHLRRLYSRLRGRGARKARDLVRRLHDAIDQCRRDITGSRSEVHALLVEMLATELAGGDRNIRDCLDLLARESPLFRKDGHRCSILLAQLHDPNSELIRWIAEDEARAAEGSTAKVSPRPQPPGPPPATPELGAPRVATTTAPPATTATPTPPMPPPAASPAPPATTATPTPPMPSPAASPAPTLSSPPTPVPPPRPPSSTEDLGPYRVLGAKDPAPSPAASSNSRATQPTVTPGISSAFTTSPTAPIAGLLDDDPDDPYDPELESLTSPSRTRLASRQKPPTPGDGGGTHGSS